MRAQEAMEELRKQRDAVRRGAAALDRKVRATEGETERLRFKAVADNSTLLGECNRLKRALEASRAEVRRLTVDLRRAVSAGKHGSTRGGARPTDTWASLGHSSFASGEGKEPAAAGAPAASSQLSDGDVNPLSGLVPVRRGRRMDAMGSKARSAASNSLPALARVSPKSTLDSRGMSASRGSLPGASAGDAGVAGAGMPRRTIASMEQQVAHAKREAKHAASQAVSLVSTVGGGSV